MPMRTCSPRLAYDARYITAQPTGIGRLCCELLEGFARLPECPPVQVLVAPDTALPPHLLEAKQLTWCHVPWNPYTPRNHLWLAPLLRQRGVRLVHSIDAFQPLRRHGLTYVMTLHDLIPLTCAAMLKRSKKSQFLPAWKAWLRWQCHQAQAVVTVSEHSAGDIVRLLHVPRHKIHVIHNPIRTWGALEPVAHFRQRLGLNGQILSYVGRHDPYKNLVGLLRAVALVTQRLPDPLHLLIVGPLDPRYPEAQTETARLGLTDTVHFLGYLDDASLGAMYQASEVFVFPSLYEGFGLPPLEAMSLGTPVVSSNRTSLPEVLGQAALFADPEQPQELADRILQVLTDPALAQRLSQTGRQHAATFTAQRAAAQYLALYASLLAPEPGTGGSS